MSVNLCLIIRAFPVTFVSRGHRRHRRRRIYQFKQFKPVYTRILYSYLFTKYLTRILSPVDISHFFPGPTGTLLDPDSVYLAPSTNSCCVSGVVSAKLSGLGRNQRSLKTHILVCLLLYYSVLSLQLLSDRFGWAVCVRHNTTSSNPTGHSLPGFLLSAHTDPPSQMSDSQNDSGPPLIRPIPRRPFDLNVREPTPPEDQDDSESPSPTRNRPPALNLESLNSRLLATKNNLHVAAATPSESGAGSSSISRAQSILNLTGSTLMGIYTPNTYGPDRISSPGTPWGTGADIPARSVPSGFDLGLGPDDNEASAMYDEDDDDLEEEDDDDDRTAIRIEKRRRSSQYAAAVMGARRSSLLQRPDVLVPQNPAAPPARPAPSPLSTPALAARLAARGLLLSALGALYGVLVARVLDRFGFAHGDHAHAHHRPPPGTIAGYDWRYLAFWGVSGVVLGGLLPWFDGVWEGGVGRRKEEDAAAAIGAGGAGGDGAAARRKSAASIGGASGAGELGGVAATAAACSADGPEKEPAVPAPDWSLAVRGIGAFAGIAFAMVGSYPSPQTTLLHLYLLFSPPPPPSLLDSLSKSANTQKTAQAFLGLDAASLDGPRPREPRPLVPDRPLGAGPPDGRRRRRRRVRALPGPGLRAAVPLAPSRWR